MSEGHRRRKRNHYQLLEDESDSPTNSLRSNGRHVDFLLCDKCWVERVRRMATKCCRTCDANLCNPCTDRHLSQKPWWLPRFIIQCWSFIFGAPSTKHDIVLLRTEYPESPDPPQWISFTEEASREFVLPRVRQSSLNSSRGSYVKTGGNNSPRTRTSNENYRPHGEMKTKTGRDNKERRGSSSSEKKRRSIETNGGQGFNGPATLSRDNYERRWDAEQTMKKTARHSEGDVHRTKDHDRQKRRSPGPEGDRYFRTEPEGKDHDLRAKKKGRISRNDGDIIRNVYGQRSRYEREELLSNTSQDSLDRASELKDTSYSVDDSNQNVIITEPADSCPICLEDIPAREARKLFCYHTIHTDCIRQLLAKVEFDFGVKCPVCNQMSNVKNYYVPRVDWVREFPIFRC